MGSRQCQGPGTPSAYIPRIASRGQYSSEKVSRRRAPHSGQGLVEAVGYVRFYPAAKEAVTVDIQGTASERIVRAPADRLRSLDLAVRRGLYVDRNLRWVGGF